MEDNEVNRIFMIELFAMNNITCDIAEDGEEAVRACRDKDYDIIFMDCQMPFMDGYEATKRIREIEGSKKHSFIIAMTANAMKGDAQKCLDAGMDEYISKPIDYDKVYDIISNHRKLFANNNFH